MGSCGVKSMVISVINIVIEHPSQLWLLTIYIFFEQMFYALVWHCKGFVIEVRNISLVGIKATSVLEYYKKYEAYILKGGELCQNETWLKDLFRRAGSNCTEVPVSLEHVRVLPPHAIRQFFRLSRYYKICQTI